MNEKLSFQNISDALAQKAGASKKVADTFTKAFFDTIVEALYMGEESIKVKGLGTFKLVAVESRESVNVSNGERITIQGYKKVSFTPEDSVVDFLNQETADGEVVEDEPVEETEPQKSKLVFEEEVPIVEEETPAIAEEEVQADAIEELIQVPEPEHVEVLQNEFSGIDLLISTPESVDEIRQQYEEAKAKMDVAVEEARKAHAEKKRLEKLLGRLEANAIPESMEEQVAEQQESAAQNAPAMQQEESVPVESVPQKETQEGAASLAVAATASAVELKPEEEKRQEAFRRYVSEQPEQQNVPSEQKGGKKSKTIWVVVLAVLLLAVIVFFLYKTSESIESVETVTPVEQPTKPVAPAKPITSAKKDSLKQPSQKSDSTKAAVSADAPQDTIQKGQNGKEQKEVKEEKPARPATYRIQRGESLTRVSQRFYGTKDSVRAIIRVNSFADPNNVPVGAVIKLP